jgi:hypothetical protein
MRPIPVVTLETEYYVHPIGNGAFRAEAVDKSYGLSFACSALGQADFALRNLCQYVQRRDNRQ